MRNLLAICLLLVSFNVFAGGKLTYKQGYNFTEKMSFPMVGLSIYQPIKFGIAYNSWTGIGRDNMWSAPRIRTTETWITTKQGLDYNFYRFTVSIGGQFERNPIEKRIETTAFGAVSLKLWD